jgi:hypothetical protein
VTPPAQTETRVERVGRCPVCSAFTYDARGLSDEAVRRLILDTEGRVLTRLISRRDGRVMSIDCGHGTLRPGARRWPRVALGGGLLLVSALALGVRSFRHVPQAVDAPVHEAPPAEQPVVPLVGSAPVDAPAPVEVPSIEPAGEAPAVAPRSAEVHLADVRSTWAPSVVIVSDLAEALRAQLGPARACYARRLEVDPSLRASLQLSMTVDHGVVRDVRVVEGMVPSLTPSHERVTGPRAGTVINSGARHPEYAAMRGCVVNAMEGLSFATPGQATVWFRLVFEGW